ncbi:MAG TPA: hypothetical protein VED46_14060 [Alphaproteobacteria bacterium]|nr:hypothetical protein [Alphaproteobacteria bacterium]
MGFPTDSDLAGHARDHGFAGRPRSPQPLDPGHPLVGVDQIYRFGVAEDDTDRLWTRNVGTENVTASSEIDGVQFNFTEWLSCIVEVSLPLDDNASAEELNGDPLANDLRVFGALMTRF